MALKRSLDSLSLVAQNQANQSGPKERYVFWETQPVTQFGASSTEDIVRPLHSITVDCENPFFLIAKRESLLL